MVAPPDNDVIWARSLHHSHNGSPALGGISLGVRDGEILAVTGPRGCGKTTLLHCLSGQLVPEQGEVWFNSVPVHTMGPRLRERLRRDRFGWIAPEPQLVPELNTWENTALPLLLRGTRAGRRRRWPWSGWSGSTSAPAPDSDRTPSSRGSASGSLWPAPWPAPPR